MSLYFKRDGDLILRSYIDASFAIHADGTSRTGRTILGFGDAAVCAWTSKQTEWMFAHNGPYETIMWGEVRKVFRKSIIGF